MPLVEPASAVANDVRWFQGLKNSRTREAKEEPRSRAEFSHRTILEYLSSSPSMRRKVSGNSRTLGFLKQEYKGNTNQADNHQHPKLVHIRPERRLLLQRLVDQSI